MIFRKTLATLTSTVALALAAAPAVVVTAQTATAQEEGEFSASDLDAFVAAYLEVNELQAEYSAQLQTAPDEETQQTIAEEGNAAIVTAIEETDGMTVELYTQILEGAGSDATLNDRITRRLNEVSEG